MDQIVNAFDWQRMLWGDAPPLYLLEIVFRTLVVYVWALILLRWLGSRTIGQLSTVEFLLVIALGSAVGDPMFYPEVPLAHALLVVTLIVLANKLLDLLVARYRTAQRVIDGGAEEVISEGAFCVPFFDSVSMGPSEVFQILRERGVEHLGQVAHAYIEPDGGIAVYLRREPVPGLPIVPPWEIKAPPRITVPEFVPKAGHYACRRCGCTINLHAHTMLDACHHCGHTHFTPAQTETRYAQPRA
jgi:uncharacterized membrane protein YcaP (DUF421 family)